MKKKRNINKYCNAINGYKRKLEEEYVTEVIDIQKLIINKWKIMVNTACKKPVFDLNAGKYWPEKLWIRTLYS